MANPFTWEELPSWTGKTPISTGYLNSIVNDLSYLYDAIINSVPFVSVTVTELATFTGSKGVTGSPADGILFTPSSFQPNGTHQLFIAEQGPGEAGYRFAVDGNINTYGGVALLWGNGTAFDTSFYRSGAGSFTFDATDAYNGMDLIFNVGGVRNGNIRVDNLGDIVINGYGTVGGGSGVYLAWDSGNGGVYFGNGAAGQVGRVDGSGNATFLTLSESAALGSKTVVKKLGEVVVTGSPQSSVTFSGISQTFRNLLLVGDLKGVANGTLLYREIGIQLNGDGGTNYQFTLSDAAGPAVESFANYGSQSYFQAGIVNGDFSTTYTNIATTLELTIYNYANTNFYKNLRGRSAFMDNNNGSTIVDSIGNWRNAGAVTQVVIFFPTIIASYAVGSTFTLYGIP